MLPLMTRSPQASGGTVLSVDWAGDVDWATKPGHAPFQVGDDTAGLICDYHDAKQRLGIPYTDTSEDENLLEFIRQVGDWIEGPGAAGRWLIPRPLSGTTTYRVHTRAGRVLRLPSQGIRSITTLGVATEDQPSTGGTYTTATSTDYYIDPPDASRDFVGAPGSRIVFLKNASGPVTQFSDAAFGAEITGGFGPATVPWAVQRVALNMVVAAHMGRGSSGGGVVTVNIDGSRSFEGFLSKADMRTLVYFSYPEPH